MKPKSTYPTWIFDGSPIADPLGYGERAVEFLRRLKHPNSTADKNRFQLNPFQERMVRGIYGPRHPDGRRVVEKVFWMIPRGNRKTSLAAALALLHTFGPEARPAGQVIFAASDREQAGIGFKEAANIVRMDERLIAATRIYDGQSSTKRIIFKKRDVVLQAVSSDGAAQHGKTPSFVLMDEIHAWKSRDLLEALTSGLVKTSGNLMIIATTAGRGSENVGFAEYGYARRVALGEIDNAAYLPIIFEAQTSDDWQDEAVWHRANPGLAHGFPNIDAMRTAAKEAKDRPAEKFAFQQFNLNIWQAHSRDPLFDMAIYDSGKVEFNPEELADLPCYLGVDLSRSGDLTAVVAAWRKADGNIYVHPWVFCPGDGLEERARGDGVPYVRWRDEKLLDVIDGPIIEPEVIQSKIIDLCARYDVREVAFDPHLAGPTMNKLIDHGVNVVVQRQTNIGMNGPICDLERTVNGFRIRHNGHPILRHHFDSVVVKRAANAGDLTTMHKGTRHGDRIDAAVAAAMAVSRATANDNRKSFLELDEDEFDRFMAGATRHD